MRSRTFGLFLSLVFLGWLLEGLVQPVIPLVILQRGGDAAIVGLVAAAYALPSVVLRPFVGRVVDRHGHAGIQGGGAVALTLAPLGFIVPGLSATVLARLVQGVAWSLYATANNVLLATLAPANRRGEASGYYNTMRALGLLVGPPLGLALFAVDAVLAFLAASLIGVVSLVLSARLRVPAPRHDPALSAGVPREASFARRWAGRVFEPSAMPYMLMIALFMSSQTIFIGFAPVFAYAIGADLAELALFYPAFGATLVITPLVGGRIADRLGRRNAIIAGCPLAATGLLIAMLPGAMLTFTLGAMCLAASIAVVTPAIAAATMDRAPAGHLASAVATYSVGYQLASGLGGAMWGVVIATIGFPWPFLGAIGLQAATVLVAWRYVGAHRPPTQVQPAP